MRTSPKVLGIDPGSRRTGFGLVAKEGTRLVHILSGVIQPDAKDSFEKRLAAIHRELSDLIHAYTPDVVAVESIFFGKNVRSSVTLAHARGVILMTAGEAGIPVAEYSPLEVKKAIVGYGRAEKDQVQLMTTRLFGISGNATRPKPDEADALAVALCHLNSATMNPRILKALAVGEATLR